MPTDGTDNDTNKRRHSRVSVDGSARIRVGSMELTCTLIDLSVGGARIGFPAMTGPMITETRGEVTI